MIKAAAQFWALEVRHLSLVIGKWSLVIGHWSLVIGHWSLRILAGIFLVTSATFASGYDWKEGKGYRSAELTLPKAGHAGFQMLPPEQTGITFTNFLAAE